MDVPKKLQEVIEHYEGHEYGLVSIQLLKDCYDLIALLEETLCEWY